MHAGEQSHTDQCVQRVGAGVGLLAELVALLAVPAPLQGHVNRQIGLRRQRAAAHQVFRPEE